MKHPVHNTFTYSLPNSIFALITTAISNRFKKRVSLYLGCEATVYLRYRTSQFPKFVRERLAFRWWYTYDIGVKIYSESSFKTYLNDCCITQVSFSLNRGQKYFLLQTKRQRSSGRAVVMEPAAIFEKVLPAYLAVEHPLGRPRSIWKHVIAKHLKSVNCADSYPSKWTIVVAGRTASRKCCKWIGHFSTF